MRLSKLQLYGYVRPDGQVGSRNYVAVIPSVFCVNEIVSAIVQRVDMCRGYLHHKGCCQLPPDLEMTTNALIKLGESPNVGAVLVVSLGCEGADADRICETLKKTGKPVDIIKVQELGGTTNSIKAGSDIAQRMAIAISGQQRQPVDMSKLVMGIKCGSSDTTSGLAANEAVGYVSDKIVDLGGTVMFSETTEFIGAEHILAKRAVNKEVGEKIFAIVKRMEDRANAVGVDMRNGQPTPGNIRGGLSSIEEKSLGAINKSGSRPIQGVLEYLESPPHAGLWIKDGPGREIEVLTNMAMGGANIISFSTGLGAPQGFVSVPVLKVCGNPNTFARMEGDMDINAGLIILGEKSIEEVGEELFAKLVACFNGEMVKSESLRYTDTMEILTYGPSI